MDISRDGKIDGGAAQRRRAARDVDAGRGRRRHLDQIDRAGLERETTGDGQRAGGVGRIARRERAAAHDHGRRRRH